MDRKSMRAEDYDQYDLRGSVYENREVLKIRGQGKKEDNILN
jgi:hypothetical protein